jgi:hypothetical protein
LGAAKRLLDSCEEMPKGYWKAYGQSLRVEESRWEMLKYHYKPIGDEGYNFPAAIGKIVASFVYFALKC